MAKPSEAPVEVPTSSVAPDQVQINQIITTILNDVEAEMVKVNNLLGSDPKYDDLKRELRRARDNAAILLGLVKDRNGNWGAA